MSAVQIIALASTVGLLAGWRLYLVTFVVGLSLRLGYLPMPQEMHSLDVLADSWIIGISAIGAIAEFFADKVPWLDSAWDSVHTLIRPIGGALLSMAIIDPGNPQWQVAALLLGGSTALLAHAGKSGARVLINASPEPYSNLVASTGEDLTTLGLLALAIKFPVAAVAVALLMVILSLAFVVAARRALGTVTRKLGALMRKRH